MPPYLLRGRPDGPEAVVAVVIWVLVGVSLRAMFCCEGSSVTEPLC